MFTQGSYPNVNTFLWNVEVAIPYNARNGVFVGSGDLDAPFVGDGALDVPLFLVSVIIIIPDYVLQINQLFILAFIIWIICKLCRVAFYQLFK